MRKLRISVVGNSGSGKSTAARMIAHAAGLARLELDSVRHQPGWRELPNDEFCDRVHAFMATHDAWVIDGNYSVVRHDVWAQANAVVWMDLPFAENMRNVVWRTVRRVTSQEELWNGNRERWTNLLSVDPYESVIAWAWTRHGVIRQRYTAAAKDPANRHLHFVRLCSRGELDDWLAELQKGTP